VLHTLSPAQKSTYETKRKNYALLLRSKLKITKIEHNCNSSTKHSYNTVQRTGAFHWSWHQFKNFERQGM